MRFIITTLLLCGVCLGEDVPYFKIYYSDELGNPEAKAHYIIRGYSEGFQTDTLVFAIPRKPPSETFNIKSGDWVSVYARLPLGIEVNLETGVLQYATKATGVEKHTIQIKCIFGDSIYYHAIIPEMAMSRVIGYFDVVDHGRSEIIDREVIKETDFTAVCTKQELFSAMTAYDKKIYEEYLDWWNKELKAQADYRRLLELKECEGK